MGVSVLTQLQCAGPTTELKSEDETGVERGADVCVSLYEHTGTPLSLASLELERKINILS